MITPDTENSSTFPADDSQDDDTLKHKKAELLQKQLHDDGIDSETEQEITREQLSLGKRLLNWRTLIPLAIVIAALVYLAQKANINPQQTWATIQSANIWFYLAAFAIYYLSFPLRAYRWRILLENVGFNKANGIQLPKFWKLVEIVYISFFANVVVPARLGELYRAYLLRQETGLSATRSFGTVLAERLLDIIVLMMLFIGAIIISLHANLPKQLELGLIASLVLVCVGIIALFMLRIFQARITSLVPKRFREQYIHFQEGVLGSFRHIPSLTGLTIGVWVCEALRFFFVAMALHLISGDLIHIGTAAIFIALGEALLTIIPFTAGGVGLVEGGMVAMIALFNPITPQTTNLATAAIVLDRSISLVSIWLIGLLVFLIAFGRHTAKQAKKS